MICDECGKRKAIFECAMCSIKLCKDCANENYGECPSCDPYLVEICTKKKSPSNKCKSKTK